MTDAKIFWTHLANRLVEDRLNKDNEAARRVWNLAVHDHYQSPNDQRVIIPKNVPGGWPPEATEEEKALLRKYVHEYQQTHSYRIQGQDWTMMFRLEERPPLWIPNGACLVQADFSGLTFFTGDYISFAEIWFLGSMRFDWAEFRCKGVDFGNAVFVGDVSFQSVKFDKASEGSNFNAARFFHGGNFESAEFSKVTFGGTPSFEPRPKTLGWT